MITRKNCCDVKSSTWSSSWSSNSKNSDESVFKISLTSPDSKWSSRWPAGVCSTSKYACVGCTPRYCSCFSASSRHKSPRLRYSWTSLQTAPTRCKTQANGVYSSYQYDDLYLWNSRVISWTTHCFEEITRAVSHNTLWKPFSDSRFHTAWSKNEWLTRKFLQNETECTLSG